MKTHGCSWVVLGFAAAGLVFSSCSGGNSTTATTAHPPHLSPTLERVDLRGIIHAHSIYSHDACDNQPEGNTECLMQLREALCTTRQDYIMLTDHAATFAEHEFPDVLLYLPEQGDELHMDDQGRPVANLIPCPDGSVVTLMAGTENDTMPVHLHQHPAGSVNDRNALYGRKDPGVVQPLHDLGASVIVNHDEGWTTQDLIDFAPDGIEVFNLHAAIDPKLRPALGVEPLGFVCDLLAFLLDCLKPNPDLAIMTFWPVTTAWTDRWDALLGVQRCFGIAATDCHRNSLPFTLSDGDRGDSYRRMMQFFGNHVLADSGTPESIEEALGAGRAYVAFDFLGLPSGFAFYATDGETKYDMGDEFPWHPGITIHVAPPVTPSAEPSGQQDTISTLLIRVDDSGSSVVAQGTGNIDYEVTGPGAYRAEVHIVPFHLRASLGSEADRLIHDYPWVYGNPIYIRAQ